VRQRVEAFYGIRAYNSYGLSEMNGPGLPLNARAEWLATSGRTPISSKWVDPKTAEPVPDGNFGELVLTTLNREAMPSSATALATSPAFCPATARAAEPTGGWIGSRDVRMTCSSIKGVNIFPIQVEQVLMSVPEVGNNYLIILQRENNIMTCWYRSK